MEGLGAVVNDTWNFGVPVADVPEAGEVVIAEIWDGVPSTVNAAYQSTVPDLSGLQEDAARTAIEGVFLVPSFTVQNQLTGTDGEVVFQSPAAGTVLTPFSTVSVTVRNLQAIVPNTAGLTEAAARTSLTNAGFAIGTVTDENETQRRRRPCDPYQSRSRPADRPWQHCEHRPQEPASRGPGHRGPDGDRGKSGADECGLRDRDRHGRERDLRGR